jgi:cystathionine beta-lyase/cystathionine gamma-synthase
VVLAPCRAALEQAGHHPIAVDRATTHRPGFPSAPIGCSSTLALGSERAYSRDDATATREAFEELIGGLERGQAVAFVSGMAAIASIVDLLPGRRRNDERTTGGGCRSGTPTAELAAAQRERSC